MPLMATRLTLSLKKATSKQSTTWGPNFPSQAAENAKFGNHTVGGMEYGTDIALHPAESVGVSHRTIRGTEYEGDIALKHISSGGRNRSSEVYG